MSPATPPSRRPRRTRSTTQRPRRAATSGAPKGDAYDVAVRYLAPRPRSVAEIARHLRSKRFDDAAIEKAIDTLRAQRYLDDEAFARYWVEQRDEHRPRGERAIV
ncbi:MAG: RecX family transcriptional regulator, partial [Chloroflexi bacterium]|nr:RecX family transcriptional regulator [Chloroflexota bacterium]